MEALRKQLAEARNVLMIVEFKIVCALEALERGEHRLIRPELTDIEARLNAFREQYPHVD